MQEQRRLQASPLLLQLCCLTSCAACGAHHGEFMLTKGRAAEMDCHTLLRAGVVVQRPMMWVQRRAAPIAPSSCCTVGISPHSVPKLHHYFMLIDLIINTDRQAPIHARSLMLNPICGALLFLFLPHSLSKTLSSSHQRRRAAATAKDLSACSASINARPLMLNLFCETFSLFCPQSLLEDKPSLQAEAVSAGPSLHCRCQ